MTADHHRTLYVAVEWCGGGCFHGMATAALSHGLDKIPAPAMPSASKDAGIHFALPSGKKAT